MAMIFAIKEFTIISRVVLASDPAHNIQEDSGKIEIDHNFHTRISENAMTSTHSIGEAPRIAGSVGEGQHPVALALEK